MKHKISLIKVLVTAFPLALMLMGIRSLFLYEQRRVHKLVDQPSATPIEEVHLKQYYLKLTHFMSPRNFDPTLQTNLLRTCAFIEGSLSGVNTGMNIHTTPPLKKNGRLWKGFLVKYEGRKSGKQDIELIEINYVHDSNKEIALGLAIGEALPGLDLKHSIHIHFTPSSEDSIFSDWGDDTNLNWNQLTKQAQGFIRSRVATQN